MSIPSYTYNRFKPTTVYGTFQNSDLSGGEVANAMFDRNITVTGNCLTGNLTATSKVTAGNLYSPVGTIDTLNCTTLTTTINNNGFGNKPSFLATNFAIANNVLSGQYSSISKTGDSIIAYDYGSNNGLCIGPWNRTGTAPFNPINTGFRMDCNGNVGINNNTPITTWDVSGNIHCSGNVYSPLGKIDTLNTTTLITTNLTVNGTLTQSSVTEIGNLTAGNLKANNKKTSGNLYSPLGTIDT